MIAQRSRTRKGHDVTSLVRRRHAAVQILVIAELAAGHGARNHRARRAQVIKKLTATQRLHARLILHVLPAGSQQQTACQGDSKRQHPG